MIPFWRIAALATRTAGWPARASAADAGESSPLPPFLSGRGTDFVI